MNVIELYTNNIVTWYTSRETKSETTLKVRLRWCKTFDVIKLLKVEQGLQKLFVQHSLGT